jgi:hypothetical protein
MYESPKRKQRTQRACDSTTAASKKGNALLGPYSSSPIGGHLAPVALTEQYVVALKYSAATRLWPRSKGLRHKVEANPLIEIVQEKP